MLRTFHFHSALRMIEPVDLYHPSEDVEVVQEDLVALEVVVEVEVAVAAASVEQVLGE